MGLRVGSPAEGAVVALEAISGSLHLADGRAVPVGARLNEGPVITYRPAGDSALRVVELIPPGKLDALRLRNTSGRLAVSVHYAWGERVHLASSAVERIGPAALASPGRLRVEVERLLDPSGPWDTGGEELTIRTAAPPGGFRLVSTGLSGTTESFGITNSPKVYRRVGTLEFDLTRAVALPSGETVDASPLLDERTLATARLGLAGLRWRRAGRTEVEILEFRVADWLR